MIRAKFEDPAVSRLGCFKLFYSSQLIKLLRETYGPEDHSKISDAELAVKAQATLQNYEANLKVVQIMAGRTGSRPTSRGNPSWHMETSRWCRSKRR